MSKILSYVWEPKVPRSSNVITALLNFCACVTSATAGYDGSMINGLNILPSYYDYFHINTVTQSLSTSALYIGSVLAGISYSRVTDILGRRAALLWAAVITVVFVIIQTCSVNIAMFTVARVFVGYGNAASTIAAPAYLAETLPFKWRGLVAAGVTYGTANWQSTWSWRLPSLFQLIFSVLCIIILFLMPESPRWLVHELRNEEALRVIAQTCANGDDQDPIAIVTYREVVETMEWERNCGETLAVTQMVKTPSARRRILLVISCALGTVIVGNQVVSYYRGTMLTNAGITDTTTQIQINIILNSFCLICAILGTLSADKIGRHPVALVSTTLLTLFLFFMGALTKLYGNSGNKSGVYGTVACIFLFMGSYLYGWTLLCYLYPPEVLNYPIRANGLGGNTIGIYGFGLMMVFAMPFILESLDWKIYIINTS
ncbi:MFS sugar transporter-like protein [Lophiostoma macrostomum CBS 122681]|uniref:MFS sugar transporter-like protein n=1 Tax=Lophiostoma macrostomum CBS 122681 TaxID=1314788 RepID=A0A6A6SK90_9PLEO|nr:MFS sugar transporter-like protein [Lophiostoma macrostomum CBS 122681]